MSEVIAFAFGVLVGSWYTRRLLIRHHQKVQDAAYRHLRLARVKQCEAEARAGRALDTALGLKQQMERTQAFLAVLQGEQVPER